jgi:hypothetical protein
MIEGRPFLYQDNEGAIYHVAEEGVGVVESWSSKEPIVAFVDSDGGIAPKIRSPVPSVQLIVASPKGTFEMDQAIRSRFTRTRFPTRN